MQFVLNYQIGWVQRFREQRTAHWHRRPEKAVAIAAIGTAEEAGDLTRPRHARELVDGSDHECREPTIDRLVDGQNGQRPSRRKVEIAIAIDAIEEQVLGLIIVGNQVEAVKTRVRFPLGTPGHGKAERRPRSGVVAAADDPYSGPVKFNRRIAQFSLRLVA